MSAPSWQEFKENLSHYHQSEPHPAVPYVLSGDQLAALAVKTVDPKTCILGNRYLTRGSGMFVIAPSGQGKSSAVMQSCACWSCGQAAFDIEPNGPQRINVIQAEDDEADLADMARVIGYLALSPQEQNLIAENSWIETLNDKIGAAAITVIDEILTLKPCDLLILNPYTAYLDGSIMDDEANSRFLRTHIQRLLNKHHCAVLIVHHTPKTNFRQKTERWSITDWMYSGAGAAVLTNWARAVLAMDPVGESGVFKFIAAKRGQRIGWEKSVNYFRHDNRPGVLLWTKATALEVANATSNGRSEITSDQLIEAIPVLDGISMMRLRKTLEQKGATQRNAKVAIELAIEDGLIHAQWLQGNGHATRVKMIYRGKDGLFTD